MKKIFYIFLLVTILISVSAALSDEDISVEINNVEENFPSDEFTALSELEFSLDVEADVERNGFRNYIYYSEVTLSPEGEEGHTTVYGDFYDSESYQPTESSSNPVLNLEYPQMDGFASAYRSTRTDLEPGESYGLELTVFIQHETEEGGIVDSDDYQLDTSLTYTGENYMYPDDDKEYTSLDGDVNGNRCNQNSIYSTESYEGNQYICECGGENCNWITEENDEQRSDNNDEEEENDRDNENSEDSEESSNEQQLPSELTRAELAAIGSVDPEYLSNENVTNLNEMDLNVDEAIVEVRDAARDNGWLKASSERVSSMGNTLSNGGEVTGPGQGMKAAGGQFIVTPGTASPYPADGCYSGHNFDAADYGEFNGNLQPSTFEGGESWNPGEYGCPSWLNGGRELYRGNVYNLNWEKLEGLRPRDDGGQESSASVSIYEGEGFDWTKFCANNAGEIGDINPEDGLSTSETVKCIETCYGSEAADEEKFGSDTECSEVVQNFCQPYYEYREDANRCDYG